MPRNPKCRKICLTPSCRMFQGASDQAAVELRLDELEALRLVDLEEFDQAKAAEHMEISRGTLQRLLYAAHRRVALALTTGRSIAIAENDNVFQHFGHTPSFALFTVEENRLTGRTDLPTGESGHGALAGLLKEHNVDVLICGGIGGGAQQALAECSIKLVGGVRGDITEAVGGYLAGTLEANPNFSCNHHHEHGEGHSCGGHGHHHGEGHSCGGHCGNH